MRKLLLACAAVAMLGCGGDSTGPAASAEGTWNLQSVNGMALPYTTIFFSSPLYRQEIMSDQVVANADGTYTETGVVRETDGANVTESTQMDAGNWTQNGNQVQIVSSLDGTTASAVVNGNKLAVNVQGSIGVYVRQ